VRHVNQTAPSAEPSRSGPVTGSPSDAAKTRGRPKTWADPAERYRAAGRRRAERARLLNQLHRAMLNARWEDPELQRVVNEGDEPRVLRALIVYFEGRHWMRGQPSPREKTLPG
jgi:hypothetical protein